MNRRLQGYEPCELSNCSIPQYRMRESNSRPPGPKPGALPNWANPVYAADTLPQYCRWRTCKKSECCHHTLWPYRSSDPTGTWTRKSPDRQSGGITNYPMRPLYILACASSIYPQIYTRTLFAIKRKPNGQGEIRTHNVSSVTVLQTACFSHFAYLP